MAINFNADEIFEMAIEIEKNGAKFYREAAEVVLEKETKKMLLAMASMEEIHLVIFEEMRKELGEDEKSGLVYDPDNEGALYLQAMADVHGWEGKAGIESKFTGDEKIEDILRSAITAEKDSVVFYMGLKSVVSARAGKEKVEAVIGEELSHLTMLNNRLLTIQRQYDR